MTDHKDSPQAILGELESIKTLLSEDELAAIPTLEDALELPSNEAQPIAETPAQEGSDSPLLADAVPVDEYEIDFDPDELPLLTEPAVADTTKETRKSPSLFSRPIDPDVEPSSQQEPLEEPEADADTQEQAFIGIEDIEVETLIDKAPELEDALTIEIPDELAEESEEYPEDHLESAQDKQDPEQESDALEPLMAPGALPGQQSLFEIPNEGEEEAAAKPEKQPKPVKAELPKAAKGENPFLPQHIRERLHTDRSLMEVIKDEPLQPALESTPAKVADSSRLLQLDLGAGSVVAISEEQLDDIIEHAVHERLKGIEYSIKEELLEQLQQKKPEE